jgi:hypothetical protein
MFRPLRFLSLSLLALAAVSSSAASAQAVRPAVVEYTGQGRGKFELVNETLFPMTVVLEPRGFRVDEAGTLTDEPFDSANVEVKLSAMSFRIPPMGTYTVFYEARARRLPAWFQVLSSMTGARTSTGLNVRLELPHVVYLLQKEPLAQEQVTVRGFSFDSAGRKAIIELSNTSASLGRVLGSELSANGRHATPFGGFPLFPQSTRRVEVPWDATESPDRVRLRFSHFAVEARRHADDR